MYIVCGNQCLDAPVPHGAAVRPNLTSLGKNTTRSGCRAVIIFYEVNPAGPFMHARVGG